MSKWVSERMDDSIKWMKKCNTPLSGGVWRYEEAGKTCLLGTDPRQHPPHQPPLPQVISSPLHTLVLPDLPHPPRKLPFPPGCHWLSQSNSPKFCAKLSFLACLRFFILFCSLLPPLERSLVSLDFGERLHFRNKHLLGNTDSIEPPTNWKANHCPSDSESFAWVWWR